MYVNTSDELGRLLRLMRSTARRVPVIVVTQKSDKTGAVVCAERLQNMIGGTGIVRTLSAMMFVHFNRAMMRFQINPRGVRLYDPTLNDLDGGARHPFWSEKDIDLLGERHVFSAIRNICAQQARYRQNGLPPVEQDKPEKVVKPKRPILTVNRSKNLELSQPIEPSPDDLIG